MHAVRLDKKKAIVTGAGGYLGREISVALAREGAQVCGIDHRQDSLKVFEDSVDTVGGTRRSYLVDITDFSETQLKVEKIVSDLGGVDILVNCAGVATRSNFEDFDEPTWLLPFKVNIHGTFHVTRVVVPHMKNNKYGRIINISSVAGMRGGRFQGRSTAYAASKAAVIGLTKALAMELAESGITVNCIAPGALDTPKLQAAPEGVLESVMAQIPQKTLCLPSDLAETVIFFSLDSARNCTGVTFRQDGGHGI